jgi:hypothetical protein
MGNHQGSASQQRRRLRWLFLTPTLVLVGVGVMEVIGEEGVDGVSEGSGTEQRDTQGARTSLRGAGPVNKLAECCEALSHMSGISKLVSGPLS